MDIGEYKNLGPIHGGFSSDWNNWSSCRFFLGNSWRFYEVDAMQYALTHEGVETGYMTVLLFQEFGPAGLVIYAVAGTVIGFISLNFQ